MAAFEHVATLVAFVFALAFTHILSTVIQLIRAGARVRYSFAHAVWFLMAPVQIFTWWLGLYDFHSLHVWSVGVIGIWLVGAVLVYLQAGLVCPEVPKDGPLDLVEFNFLHARQYLGAALASLVPTVVLGIYGNGASLPDQLIQTAFAVAGSIPLLIAFMFRRTAVQNVCAAIQLVSVPVYIYYAQHALS
jgi:hypothetical protein